MSFEKREQSRTRQHPRAQQPRLQADMLSARGCGMSTALVVCADHLEAEEQHFATGGHASAAERVGAVADCVRAATVG